MLPPRVVLRLSFVTAQQLRLRAEFRSGLSTATRL